jgi:hypothetical protein
MKGNRGFIKAIILIVIALVVLGFFGYNLESIVNSPDVKGNLAYVWELLVKLWSILLAPLTWVWDNVVIKLVWSNLQPLLSK